MDEEEPPHEDTPEERKRKLAWLIVGLVGAVAAGVLLASSVWTGEWKSSGNSVGNELVENKAGVDPQTWCAAQSTYDAIRRELFRRAAQIRGADDQAYTRLSDFALLRMEAPVLRGIDDRLQSVVCSGNAALDLPPGVSVSDGRSSLSAEIDYSVQAAADGSGMVVRVGNADAIIIPLATVSSSMIRPPALAGMAMREQSNETASESAAGTQPPPSGNGVQAPVEARNEIEGAPPVNNVEE